MAYFHMGKSTTKVKIDKINEGRSFFQNAVVPSGMGISKLHGRVDLASVWGFHASREQGEE